MWTVGHIFTRSYIYGWSKTKSHNLSTYIWKKNSYKKTILVKSFKIYAACTLSQRVFSDNQVSRSQVCSYQCPVSLLAQTQSFNGSLAAIIVIGDHWLGNFRHSLRVIHIYWIIRSGNMKVTWYFVEIEADRLGFGSNVKVIIVLQQNWNFAKVDISGKATVSSKVL